MQKNRWTWPIIVLAAIALIAVGCREEPTLPPDEMVDVEVDPIPIEEEPEVEEAPEDRTRELIDDLYQALADGDSAAFMTNVTGPEAATELTAALAEHIAASLQFRNEFIEEYGEQAWADYRAAEGRKLNLVEKTVDHTIEIDDGEATVTETGFGLPLQLTEVDGEWNVRAESFVPENITEPGTYAQMAREMAQAVEDARRQIGESDLRPEDIRITVPEAVVERERE